MAISHTLVINQGFTPNASVYTTTATLTSVANRLYLAGASWSGTVLRTFTSLVHNAGSNPLTFVKMGDVTSNTVATPLQRTVSCRALKGTASNAGTVTLTLSGTVSRACLIISEFDGVNTGGTDGSGAVLQSTLSNSGDAAATLTLTFAAFSATDNRPWAYGSGDVASMTWTPDANYVEIGETAGGTEVLTTEAQWDDNGQDTGCTFDGSSNADMGLVGVEIVAAATAVSDYVPVSHPTLHLLIR